MREEYDFSKGKRAKDIPHLAQLQREAKDKTRNVLSVFRAHAQAKTLGASDIATKADLLELKMDIIKWMVGLALAQVGLLIGILIKLL